MDGVRLRVVVRGISPIIVRTIDVPAAVSLPLLHEVLLAALGWSGECLWVFEVRGRSYSDAWMVDADPARGVTIGSLQLRHGERFRWRYDFIAGWVLDARVEAGVDVDTVMVVSGRRAGPPEWLAGSHEFAVWEDSHSLLEVADIVDEVLDAGPIDGPDMLHDRLVPLAPWLGRDRFDRSRVRRRVHDVVRGWALREGSSCVSPSKSESTPTTTAGVS